jgi:hypothetical protein
VTLSVSERFLVWRYERRGGDKPTKVPYSPKPPFLNASTTDPATWGTYEQAARRFEADSSFAGIGFIFAKGDGTAGIDLDNAVDADGHIPRWAREIIETHDTYTELSPSLTGIHLLEKASKPMTAGSHLKGIGPDGKSRIEIYDQARFFTLTALPVPGYEHLVHRLLEPRQRQLDQLCQLIWPEGARTLAGRGLELDDDEAAHRVAEFTAGVSALAMAWREYRCRRFILTIPKAISGEYGHYATFRAACELFRFGLNTEAAWRVLQIYNDQRCEPPWDNHELGRKLREGRRRVMDDGAFAVRLDDYQLKDQPHARR